MWKGYIELGDMCVNFGCYVVILLFCLSIRFFISKKKLNLFIFWVVVKISKNNIYGNICKLRNIFKY